MRYGSLFIWSLWLYETNNMRNNKCYCCKILTTPWLLMLNSFHLGTECFGYLVMIHPVTLPGLLKIFPNIIFKVTMYFETSAFQKTLKSIFIFCPGNHWGGQHTGSSHQRQSKDPSRPPAADQRTPHDRGSVFSHYLTCIFILSLFHINFVISKSYYLWLLTLRRPPPMACWLLTWLLRRTVSPPTMMATHRNPGRTASGLTCRGGVPLDRWQLLDLGRLAVARGLAQMSPSSGWPPRSPRWKPAVCQGAVSDPGANIPTWRSLRSTRHSRCRWVTFLTFWY